MKKSKRYGIRKVLGKKQHRKDFNEQLPKLLMNLEEHIALYRSDNGCDPTKFWIRMHSCGIFGLGVGDLEGLKDASNEICFACGNGLMQTYIAESKEALIAALKSL